MDGSLDLAHPTYPYEVSASLVDRHKFSCTVCGVQEYNHNTMYMATKEVNSIDTCVMQFPKKVCV